MRKQLTVMLVTLIPYWLAPTSLPAGECNPQLSQAQSDYLQQHQLEIAVPGGDLPSIQRCDTNHDNWVDIADIREIALERNRPVRHPDDPMDWDKNGVINLLDVRGCQRACAAARCAPKSSYESEPEQMVGGTVEDAGCFQTEDLDGNGTQDFTGIFEYTGNVNRGNNWNLNLVILIEDGSGNVQHVEYPYTGQVTANEGDLRQHLSVQPAGLVDLNPRSITIPQPGIVSYRDGEPKTIYYFFNGTLQRGIYGVHD